MTRVLRVEPGQLFEISDNRAAWLAEVAEARGEHVVFRIVEPAPSPALPVRMTLIAALVKFDRFEWMIEKATELGVERILPIDAARTEKGLLEAAKKRAERWRRIAREGSQQSRRTSVPEILPAACFEACLAEPSSYRYWMEEEAAPPLASLFPANRAAVDQVAVTIGPEGGWTDGERQSALAAGWRPASLGPLILRAETAAAAALSIVGNAWMAANSLQ